MTDLGAPVTVAGPVSARMVFSVRKTRSVKLGAGQDVMTVISPFSVN